MNSSKKIRLHTGAKVLLLSYHGRLDFPEYFRIGFTEQFHFNEDYNVITAKARIQLDSGSWFSVMPDQVRHDGKLWTVKISISFEN
jgi:hypothetical protein